MLINKALHQVHIGKWLIPGHPKRHRMACVYRDGIYNYIKKMPQIQLFCVFLHF